MRSLKKIEDALQGNPVLVISIGLFLGISAALLIIPPDWYPGWFFPKLTAMGGAIYASVLLAINLIFPLSKKYTEQIRNRKYLARRRLQNYVAICCTLGFAGSLGLYEFQIPFDKFNHFIIAVLLTVGISGFIHRWYDVPITRALLITIGIVVVADIAWEFLEFGSDALLGTKAFGLRGTEHFLDTFLDALWEAIGITLASFTVLARKKPWPY